MVYSQQVYGHERKNNAGFVERKSKSEQISNAKDVNIIQLKYDSN